MTTLFLQSTSSVVNKVLAFSSLSTRLSKSHPPQSIIVSRAFTSFTTTDTKRTSILQQSSTSQRHQEDLSAEFSSLSSDGGYNLPQVQWYPGHIAKAERQLSETLKAVDVVVEVRDARACKATAHPKVGEWAGGKPRIVVLTHLDTVPKASSSSWRKAYETLGAERWDDAPINKQVANQATQARDIRSQYASVGDDPNNNVNDNSKKNKKRRKNTAKSIIATNNKQVANAITPVEQVLFVNAKQGQGIHALHRAIFKAGAHVQERRERRGLNPRALRVGIIGYPNGMSCCFLYYCSVLSSCLCEFVFVRFYLSLFLPYAHYACFGYDSIIIVGKVRF